MTTVTKLDIAEYLDTPEAIQAFLDEAMETGSNEEFIHALSIAARAKGMTEVAEKAGVSRPSLYKSLSANGSPAYETISKVVNALGCKLVVG